jgi:hypothetical protein
MRITSRRDGIFAKSQFAGLAWTNRASCFTMEASVAAIAKATMCPTHVRAM